MVEKKWAFDSDSTRGYTNIRQVFIGKFLAAIREQVELASALDVGCGVGYFAKFLSDLGFRVVATDGRPENSQEGKRRFPEITFRTIDVEDAAFPEIGKFDFVLCAGLLYHLENPFVAVRNLFAMTGKVAILEGQCVPGNEPIFVVRDESPTEDQGLRHVALYPSESGLVKLLYRSGFSHVYRLRVPLAHRDYESSLTRSRVRTILLATTVQPLIDLLVRAADPVTKPDPWEIRNSPAALARCALKPLVRLWQDSRKK